MKAQYASPSIEKLTQTPGTEFTSEARRVDGPSLARMLRVTRATSLVVRQGYDLIGRLQRDRHGSLRFPPDRSTDSGAGRDRNRRGHCGSY